jgi:hypothetical protein
MFKDLQNTLQKTMKELESNLEQLQSKMTKEEFEFFEGHKKRFSKAFKNKDVSSLNKVSKDLQDFVNKNS